MYTGTGNEGVVVALTKDRPGEPGRATFTRGGAVLWGTGMTKPDPGLQRESERGELKGHREAPKAVEAMLQRTPWGGAPVQYSTAQTETEREAYRR
jgi:hypothetical protein